MITSHSELGSLAASITRQSSKQTYTMIRLLVDRDRVQDAFRAYAYFRWVDDILDAAEGTQAEKAVFAERQRGLMEDLYRGVIPLELSPEEKLLQDLVKTDPDPDSGLYNYLDRMMAVMEFDAGRRGKLISQTELEEYAHNLAVAVTEAMHYFIGHGHYAPQNENRYLAVTAAHITHMLRDALDDTRQGYHNIPQEYLLAHRLTPCDNQKEAYRKWVCSRVKLARTYFKAGRAYLSQVKNLRCRLAGYAYTARFEWVLRTIERENFCLRLEYPDRKSFRSALWMVWNTLKSFRKIPFWKRTYIPLPQPGIEITNT
ncbi:MAG: squalene/phytoene synthase family protein [Anaerolineales bacterium]